MSSSKKYESVLLNLLIFLKVEERRWIGYLSDFMLLNPFFTEAYFVGVRLQHTFVISHALTYYHIFIGPSCTIGALNY